jgi:NAD(P)-dependent dehydrogenase (short-subunit alcohol dehydrogenase family)
MTESVVDTGPERVGAPRLDLVEIFRLDGKVALVTGASYGLGVLFAEILATAGADVVVTARSVDKLEMTKDLVGGLGRRCLAIPGDVTSYDDCERVVQRTMEEFGHIDVLVNNAAQAQLGWFETVDDADVRRNFEVNVFGAMHVARAVLPHLRARRSGLLVTISSVNGLVANAGGSIYSATKFAVEGWAEGLAQEVAPLGIRSLVVEPGMMRTDFLGDRSMRQGGLDVPDYADAVAQFRTFIASAHQQQPGDPAQLAARIVALAATPSPPERLVFGDDALAWAAAKVDRLRAEIAWSSA